MAKYKIGDKVRIVSERPADHWNPEMDKWLGRVMQSVSDLDVKPVGKER